MADGPSGRSEYRVRLSSGRELGPLSLERIQRLIEKKHIIGDERVRVLPSKEWVAFGSVAELASLLVPKDSEDAPASAPESDLPPLTLTPDLDIEPVSKPELPAEASPAHVPLVSDEDERTQVMASGSDLGEPDSERTLVATLTQGAADPNTRNLEPIAIRTDGFEPPSESESRHTFSGPDVSGEKTIVLDPESLGQLPDPSRPAPVAKPALLGGRQQRIQVLRWLVVVLGFTAVINEFLNPTPEEKPPFRLKPFECQIGSPAKNQDPRKSAEEYEAGRIHYYKDNVDQYRKAAARFKNSISLDKTNLQAKALLLSSCLNLSELSKKDETFSSSVLTLSEAVKAHLADRNLVVEALIAQVEYYLFNGKPDAALHAVQDYSEMMRAASVQHGQIIVDYLNALAMARKGNAQNAINLLHRYSDEQIPVPRIFYLRGQIGEMIGQLDFASGEYRKAVAVEKAHAKSLLRLAEIQIKKGEYSEAGPILAHLTAHPEDMTPAEIARSWFLESRLNLAFERTRDAVRAIEKALKFDPTQREYILESYRQKARLKDPTPKMQREAKMYFHIMEANRLFESGEPEKAKATYLQASLENPDSEIPFTELGDLFMRQRRTTEARDAYRNAAFRNKKDVNIWSKYIYSLIESYAFDEAEKQMTALRKMDVPQSAVDKAAGDLSQKREQYDLAQAHYRNALSRSYVDPAVYVAYGNSLLVTRNYKEAELNFTLALRQDPLNSAAIIGLAKTIKETEGPTGGIENAIKYLEEQLQKRGAAPGAGELYTAIAQFELDRRATDKAKERLRLAFSVEPELPTPWKVMADILADEYRMLPGRPDKIKEKKARFEEALAAYESYSVRAPSDPSGHYAKFLLMFYTSSQAKSGFIVDAIKELEKIKVSVPHYPRLNYSFGLCNMELGEYQAAIRDFEEEIKAYPENLDAIIAKGKAYIALGKLADARNVLTQAMQLRPESYEAKILAGDVAFKEGRYQVALTLYQLAASLNPGSPDVHNKLAETYTKLGDQANAQKAAQEARRQQGF